MSKPIIRHKPCVLFGETYADELSESELAEFDGKVDEVRYYYEYTSYDGRGLALLRRGTEFAIHDLGHCSCYGPTDYFSSNDVDWYPSIKSLYTACYDEQKKKLHPLLDYHETADLTTPDTTPPSNPPTTTHYAQ